jgi:putative transposase
MLEWYRRWSHTLTNLKVHIIWCTKYRKRVLKWELKKRCRDILKRICDDMDIVILQWVVSYDHIHMHIEFPTKYSLSEIAKRMKWKTSRYLQSEFQELKKEYWWRHLRSSGYFAATTGNVTDEVLQAYLQHHIDPNANIKDDGIFILEWE